MKSLAARLAYLCGSGAANDQIITNGCDNRRSGCVSRYLKSGVVA